MKDWQVGRDDLPHNIAPHAVPHHLMRQLEWIDLLLQRHVHRQQGRITPSGEFLLSPEETENRVAQPCGVPHWWTTQVSTLPSGPHGTGSWLAADFELTEFEWNVLLLGLLVHADSRYHGLFSAAQGQERNRSLPTIELALNLFCTTASEKLDHEGSFLGTAPLVFNGFIEYSDAGGAYKRGWRQRCFTTHHGVYRYLFEQTCECPDLVGLSQLTADPWPLVSHAPFMAELRDAFSRGAPGIRPIVILRGARDIGCSQLVCNAAAELGGGTFELNCDTVNQRGEAALDIYRHVFREMRMRRACLVMRELGVSVEDGGELLNEVARLLTQPGLNVVCLLEPDTRLPKLPGIPRLLLDVPDTSMHEKERMLRDCLPIESSIDCVALSRRFSFSPHDLPMILQEAELYRQQRDADTSLGEEDVRKALRLRAQQNFGKLARRSSPTRCFDDLIVSDGLQQQLNEVLSAIQYRERLLERGFSEKLGYGTGISALFYGDSGTGKTMAAEVIAAQLGVDLIKIDLSAVVNKYIGETEKNLARVFDLAERDAGVLFFDEADALFGKRSETKDAQDRHANIEVSYLLQRLENYPGLVILATNNRSHLDDAFSRRFTFMIRFPFPDAALREQMWRSIWPASIRIGDDVDFPQLARRAELTGANIRNIALLAAWLSEAEGAGQINHRHLDLALKRELAKVGRLVLEPHSRELRQ